MSVSFAKTIRPAKGGDTRPFRPQLTSLVDVMTILLVFLIKSFSVEGNLVTPSPDLEPPFSTAEKPPRRVCTVEITKSAVASEGTIIAPIASFVDRDSLVVPPLFDWLKLEQAKCEDTAAAQDVLIQADKEIAFDVLKRVMYTCSKAGFDDFSVLVIEEE